MYLVIMLMVTQKVVDRYGGNFLNRQPTELSYLIFQHLTQVGGTMSDFHIRQSEGGNAIIFVFVRSFVCIAHK